MLRRIHVPTISTGEMVLDAAQARHARDALRLEPGTSVEIFDDAGRVALGELVMNGKKLAVRLTELRGESEGRQSTSLVIAAAVPKGERADWMIEKLSELGVTEFIPLAAARSVVLPEGTGKRERWMRIATESAKQSRRRGVMRIGELTNVDDLLATSKDGNRTLGLFFSTDPGASPVGQSLSPNVTSITTLIGPEGGWTDDETQAFAAAGLRSAKLTDTILRVETAAVAAAAVIGTLLAEQRAKHA